MIELLEPYQIRVLEFKADQIEFRTVLSLTARESVATAVSKMKGRISKWIQSRSTTTNNSRTLAKGYFAVTTGQSTTDQIDAYLDRQGAQHGYHLRARPPIFVKAFEKPMETQLRLSCYHAMTSIRFHIVLATEWRNGVFGERSGQAIADSWKASERADHFFISKVSFVPDHVHIAVETAPITSPATVVLSLMNTAQELMWKQFQGDVIRAGVGRLWQPSAYLGSYGDLSSNALVAYIKGWEQL